MCFKIDRRIKAWPETTVFKLVKRTKYPHRHVSSHHWAQATYIANQPVGIDPSSAATQYAGRTSAGIYVCRTLEAARAYAAQFSKRMVKSAYCIVECKVRPEDFLHAAHNRKLKGATWNYAGCATYRRVTPTTRRHAVKAGGKL
jgi:hypothetical protein